MTSDLLPPRFPDEIGEEGAVLFLKDGHEFRLARVNEQTWVIHSSGRPAEEFQLFVTKDGDRWSVDGRNGVVFPAAMGVTTGEVFSLFF
jgi:hypothetical protein